MGCGCDFSSSGDLRRRCEAHSLAPAGTDLVVVTPEFLLLQELGKLHKTMESVLQALANQTRAIERLARRVNHL